MGVSQSRRQTPLAAPLLREASKAPEDRKRTRFLRRYEERGGLDPTAEHADFLVVFDHPEETAIGERLSWADAENLWFQAIPGFEDEKLAGVAALREAWTAKFRVDEVADGDTVPLESFRALTREHVVEELRAAGVDVTTRLSRDGTRVYALCRAQAARLEKEAARVGYALPFKAEVDPGREFWLGGKYRDAEGRDCYPEIDEDNVVYDASEANELLEDLYRAGRVPPEDAAVFPPEEEPTARHWSRRLHALERVADRVPATNRWPAHAPYRLKRSHRHLYTTRHTARGPSLVAPADRLLLTKQLMDRAVFLDVLADNGVLPFFFPLHDGAARCDGIDVLDFLDTWCLFWRADARTSGAPAVTHPAYLAEAPCPWYWRPYAQPLREIRDYFGDEVALHFAWASYYARSLLVPLVAVLVLEVASQRSPGGLMSWRRGGYQVAIAVVVVLWCAIFVESWAVEERYCAIAWGATALDDEDERVPRPQFRATTRRLSPVTNTNEAYFPPYVRGRRRVLGYAAVAGCVAAQSAAVVGIFKVENMALRAGADVGLAVSWAAFGVATLAVLASRGFRLVATALTTYENYKFEEDHEMHLVQKRAAFEVFNSFGPVAFALFFQKLAFGRCAFDDCVVDAEILAGVIFVGRFVALCVGQAIRYGGAKRDARAAAYEVSREQFGADVDEEARQALGGPPEWLAEVHGRGGDPFVLMRDAKLDATIQFGLVAALSLVTWIVPAVAAAEAAFAFRADAWTLVAKLQRPSPRRTATVGAWLRLSRLVSVAAIFVNAGVVAFASSWLDGKGLNVRLLCFFCVYEGLLSVYVCATLFYPSEPEKLGDVVKRNAYVVKRHTKPAFHDAAGREDLHPGNVDRDDEAPRNLLPLDADASKKLEFLRATYDESRENLKALRARYATALAAEDYRPACGVSYSRRSPDLALGMLTLTLLEIQDLGERDFPVAKPQDLVCYVAVRDLTSPSTRGYEGAVAPGVQVSRPPRRARDVRGRPQDAFGGLLVFSQCFTVAPIKSKHATLIVSVVDVRRKRKVASATQALADLAHQRTARLQLAMARADDEAAKRPPDSAPPVLYLKARFQHSKVLPLKHQIYDALQHQRKLRRDITNLRHHKPVEHDWPFPEDAPELGRTIRRGDSRPDDSSRARLEPVRSVADLNAADLV